MGFMWGLLTGQHDDDGAKSRTVNSPQEVSIKRSSLWGVFTGQHGEEDTVRAAGYHSGIDDVWAKRVAYHEAGHGRAAARGGFSVSGMFALSNGAGFTSYSGEMSEHPSDPKIRANLVAILAGQEAECRYLMDHHGYSYKAALRETEAGAAGDLAAFADESAGTGYTLAEIRAEAHRLVRRQAYTIETNAKPLYRNGSRGGTWA